MALVRWATLFLVTFFVLASCAAAETSFFADWVYPGDTFTANNTLFALSAASTTSQALLQRGNEEYLIGYGNCVITNDGLEKYCYNGSDYVACQHHTYDCGDGTFNCCPLDVAHVRFDAGQAVYAAYLELFDVVPDVTVTRSPDQTSLKLGATATITITLVNTGENALLGLQYVETVPQGFTITSSSPEFRQSGNTLAATLNLGPGVTHNLQYTVTPQEYVTGTFNASLAYTYKSVQEAVVPSSFAINVPSPFLVTHTLNPPTSLPPGTAATYTYTLTNNDGQYNMDAALDFTGLLPLTGTTTLPSGVTRQHDDYVWHDTITPGQTLTLAFPLLAGKTGLYPVTANATMTVNGATFVYSVQDTCTVQATPPLPDVRVKTSLAAGGTYTVRLFLNNTASNTAYSNVNALLTTTPPVLQPQSFSLAALAIGDIPLLGAVNFTAPVNASRVTFTFNGTYDTAYEHGLAFSKIVTASVAPGGPPYLLATVVNATNATPGQRLSVTVTITNEQDVYGSVDVTDTLPAGAIVAAGTREMAMSLNAGQAREAYTYDVIIPESYQARVFTITTQLLDKQSGSRSLIRRLSP